MHARTHRYALIAGLVLTFLAVGKVAEAQNLRVIPVPWVATDPTIPHQAYNDNATTFKAIARGGNGSYSYRWDYDGPGPMAYTAPVVTSNRRNLSAIFTYPDQAVTTTFFATIEVTSNGQTRTGTYPVRVFADVPTDPALASDRQLQVMRGVAVDDGLWYLHNQMVPTGNEDDPLTGAQITGTIIDNTSGYGPGTGTMGYLWALSLNGHFAAFPSAYIGELPDAAANTQRWEQDPYAEDSARIVNYMLTQLDPVPVVALDESNLVGFYPEFQKAPIFGSDDLVGLYFSYSIADTDANKNVYPMGHATSAFSVANMVGYVAQVGDPAQVLGRRLEFVLQQMVDALVWHQNDGAPDLGAWYYYPNLNNNDDLSTALWGITGLWHADEFAQGQGVIVPNIVKTRMVEYLFQNSNTGAGCAAGQRGGSYDTVNSQCDFTLSAAHLLGFGWVNANQFTSGDTRLAFPAYSTIQRGTLRDYFDGVYNFISANFNGFVVGQHNWNTQFVQGGDWASANNQGNHYAMLHWQDAARGAEPEVALFGTNDWSRRFSQYLINNEYADGHWDSVGGGNHGTMSDQYSGPNLNTVHALLVLSPDAIPPLAIAEPSTLSAPEGTPIVFDGSESDPGTGNPVYVWNFDNGATMPGQTVTYAFPDNRVAPYQVKLQSTSIGGTSIDTVAVQISNVAPTTTAPADRVVDEGASSSFTMTFTDPGTADTHFFLWNWADLTATASTQTASHSWADNGSFNVSARVTDDDGGTTQDVTAVTVNNVPPTVTSNGPSTADEGVAYTYTVTYTDPGTADTHTCRADTIPQGMTQTPAGTGCQFDWTPNFNQALGATAPVSICVVDDDGGEDCDDYEIDVDFTDDDFDGLPDSWEIVNFGDITSYDGLQDPDGDGMLNIQEFNNLTDPLDYDGPEAPVALAPACGTEIATFQINLVVTNATDPQNDTLLYEFQLFSDVGLTIPVASEDDLDEGALGTTTWGVPVNLVENQTYYWRARAEDAFTFGEYTSPICDFFVNTVNEAPGVPRINNPAFGAQVNSLTPNLTVDNATDPDLDVLTYEFEVYADPALSNLVANQLGVASGATTTSWTVDLNLTEDVFYYWRVRATDPDGLSGDWSNTGQFFVTTVNAPPEAPVILSPAEGTIVTIPRPDLIMLNTDDADFDQLVFDWELSSDNTFGTIIDSDTDAPPQGDATTAFPLAADLVEDTRYCWRVRADDGAATSVYTTACFLMSENNDPPNVPTLMNPGDNGLVNSLVPSFSWAIATDPEGSAVTYDIEVMDEGGEVIGTADGVTGTVTSMGDELEEGGEYSWRARAVDAQGVASDFSEENRFAVSLGLDGDPAVIVNGKGCSTGGGGAGGAGLMGLGLAFLLRRRRR